MQKNQTAFWIFCFTLITCSNPVADKSQTNKINVDTFSADTTAVQKDELGKIYIQAIAEFIKAANKKNGAGFDTLFFGKRAYGKPDDFPNIELPETIENTPVRLITPEIGLKKQQERNSLVYINMIGWVDKEKAEFILVVFSNGGEHQYDYTINFIYSSARKDFVLDKILFENYLNNKEEKPKRITIYNNGKYTGD